MVVISGKDGGEWAEIAIRKFLNNEINNNSININSWEYDYDRDVGNHPHL
ncbi:MAG: hypothetical protein ACK5LT_04205 [Lachnospirales bacterium]